MTLNLKAFFRVICKSNRIF